jgi:YVTN family beta-propeller protein
MYVTKPLAQLVERYDLPSHTRTLTIPMPGEPVNVAFIPDGTKAYVSDFGIAQVNVIDVATNTVTAHVAMPGVNNYILASTDGSKVYVTVGTKLCAINTATNAVTTVFNSDGGVSSLTMNPATPWMYFFSDSGVYEWDQGADTVRRHGRLFPIGDNVFVQDMAFSADGSKLFVADEIGELRVHDGVTFAFQSFFPFWTDGFGLKVTKDGSKIWMTRPTSPGPLAVAFDESTHEELVSYSAGRSRRIAFDKSGNTAIITSETGYLTFITWP